MGSSLGGQGNSAGARGVKQMDVSVDDGDRRGSGDRVACGGHSGGGERSSGESSLVDVGQWWERAIMRRIRLLALCMGLTAVAHSAQIGGENFPLIVNVVDAVTGKARADVELFLQDLKWKNIAGPVKPDAAGKAEFRVPAGNYILRAETASFAVYYGQLPDGMVQTVEVSADGKPEARIVRGSIAGHW